MYQMSCARSCEYCNVSEITEAQAPIQATGASSLSKAIDGGADRELNGSERLGERGGSGSNRALGHLIRHRHREDTGRVGPRSAPAPCSDRWQRLRCLGSFEFGDKEELCTKLMYRTNCASSCGVCRAPEEARHAQVQQLSVEQEHATLAKEPALLLPTTDNKCVDQLIMDYCRRAVQEGKCPMEIYRKGCALSCIQC